jgi:hypothetical protein
MLCFVRANSAMPDFCYARFGASEVLLGASEVLLGASEVLLGARTNPRCQLGLLSQSSISNGTLSSWPQETLGPCLQRA